MDTEPEQEQKPQNYKQVWGHIEGGEIPRRLKIAQDVWELT